MAIGNVIKKLRLQKGISQQQLCDALNIEQSTLANYESNRRTPKPEILNRLADYFFVSVDYLFERSENESDINPLTGEKLTKIEKNQLTEAQEKAKALFFDDAVSESDKEKFLRDITEMFWEAKDMNRHKKTK